MNNSSFNEGYEHGGCSFQKYENIVYAFLFVTIALTAVIGNVMVIICYLRYRMLRFTTNVFIISLSASDILVAVLSIPYTFGVLLCNFVPHVGDLMTVYILCDMLPSILSIYSLCLVAVDRTLAILKPYFHKRHINQRIAIISVIVMWLFVGSLVAFHFVMDARMFTMFIITMSYLLPVFVMIVSYSLMGYVAKTHTAEINRLHRTASQLRQSEQYGSETDNDDQYSIDPLVIKFQKAGALVKIKSTFGSKLFNLFPSTTGQRGSVESTATASSLIPREFKAAMTLSLLLSCFIISWTPFIALNLEHFRCEHEVFQM